MTNVGPVEVRVPRDVAGSFDPQQVCKRQRRLSGADEMLLSLPAKGIAHERYARIWPRRTTQHRTAGADECACSVAAS
ncbi:transposase [Nonomuraea sp. NPDC003707]